jgi:hypothetical protein
MFVNRAPPPPVNLVLQHCCKALQSLYCTICRLFILFIAYSRTIRTIRRLFASLRGANEGECGGCDTPPPIFKHSVLMVIIKSVPWNQIQRTFYARSKGRDGRLWLHISPVSMEHRGNYSSTKHLKITFTIFWMRTILSEPIASSYSYTRGIGVREEKN